MLSWAVGSVQEDANAMVWPLVNICTGLFLLALAFKCAPAPR